MSKTTAGFLPLCSALRAALSMSFLAPASMRARSLAYGLVAEAWYTPALSAVVP